MSPLELDFYLDPVCGWAWRTSLWMREVATQRPLTITWKLASLGVINAPADWQPGSTSHRLRGAHLGRTLVMADRVAGNDAFNRLAISFGNAMHGRADDMNDPAVIARCLADAELPEDLYQAAQADQSTETEMIDQTRAVIQRLKLFGVPTIALAGSDLGVFGPVDPPRTHRPRGPRAMGRGPSVAQESVPVRAEAHPRALRSAPVCRRARARRRSGRGARVSLPSITIEYCLECCETLRAVREAQEILVEFEDRIKQVSLVPGGNGVFEVAVDEHLVFSKKRLGRHAEEGELARLVGSALRSA